MLKVHVARNIVSLERETGTCSSVVSCGFSCTCAYTILEKCSQVHETYMYMCTVCVGSVKVFM